MASFVARAMGLPGMAPPPRPGRSPAFTGDTLIHLPTAWWAAAYGESGVAYDFRPMFDPVKPLIEAAVVALCHLEVPLTARSTGLSGYPLFSAPAVVADALAWAGYDGCSTASNHAIDQRFSGLVETFEVLEAAGLGHAGTAATEADSQQITMYDAKASPSLTSRRFGG